MLPAVEFDAALEVDDAYPFSEKLPGLGEVSECTSSKKGSGAGGSRYPSRRSYESKRSGRISNKKTTSSDNVRTANEIYRLAHARVEGQMQ